MTDQPPMGFAGLAAQVSAIPDRVDPPAKPAEQPKLYLGLVVGVGLLITKLFLSYGLPKNPTYTPTSVITYAPGPTIQSSPPTSSPSVQSTTFQSTAISEVKPEAGLKRSLTQSEILYCLAESARLNVMDPLVDEQSPAQLNGFNGLVADYNVRCLDYNYRQADLDAAQRRIELLRPVLRTQAKDQLAAWR
ncbi:hypothetical protein ACQR1I_12005 [Bradyrhizobium sp. HKCCYLS2038]|uniref:hypothetical protein n=1 Tax=unclassified Bradyrhizobium TaxID=2631580 RepID=UPI003EB702D6